MEPEARAEKASQPYLLLALSVLFLLGVCVGIGMVFQLTLAQKATLARSFQAYFQVQPSTSIVNLFWMNLKWIICIVVFGYTVIGLPFVFVLNVLKGILMGFTLASFIDQYAWKGVLFGVVTLLPSALFIVPALFFVSVASVTMASRFLRTRTFRPNSWPLLRTFAVMVVVTAFAACFESVVLPRILATLTPWLLAN
jgi:stage II sporulation protein M